MQRQDEANKVTLPVVVDTLPGRDMRISVIDRQNYNIPKSLKRPHLLSPTHKNKMRELPY